jgi:hypothetical protein
MSARWAFGPPLSTSAAGWAGATGRPGWARSSTRPAGTNEKAAMEWSEQRGFWLISWPELEQDVLELGWR